MNTSKIGSILATAIIWILVGVDDAGNITHVWDKKYISKKHCLTRLAKTKAINDALKKTGSSSYKDVTFHCLAHKWDGTPGRMTFEETE